MRKFFVFCLCCILCLTCFSCSQQTNVSDQTASEDASKTAPAKPSNSPAAPPSPTSHLLQKEEVRENIRFRVPSAWRREASDSSDIWFYYPSEDNTRGVLGMSIKRIKADPYDYTDMTLTKKHLDDAISDLQTGDGTSEFAIEQEFELSGVPAALLSKKLEINRQIYDSKSVCFVYHKSIITFVYYSPEGESNELTKTFPAIVDSIRIEQKQPNFLANPELIRAINQSNSEFKFDEIIALADAYIIENNPEPEDIVFAIKSAAETATVQMQNCNSRTDEFEGTTVVYGSVSELSSKINFVPLIQQEPAFCGDIAVMVGFKQKGWLFFEGIKVKVGEERYVADGFRYDDVRREVIYGDIILEETTASFRFEEVEAILSAQEPTLHFIGKGEKMRTHTLTDEEKSSLQAIYDLAKSRDTISAALKDAK